MNKKDAIEEIKEVLEKHNITVADLGEAIKSPKREPIEDKELSYSLIFNGVEVVRDSVYYIDEPDWDSLEQDIIYDHITDLEDMVAESIMDYDILDLDYCINFADKKNTVIEGSLYLESVNVDLGANL